MISFDDYRVVDLSPRIKARVHRVDGTIEEGTNDPYGKPWVMQEWVAMTLLQSLWPLQEILCTQCLWTVRVIP